MNAEPLEAVMQAETTVEHTSVGVFLDEEISLSFIAETGLRRRVTVYGRITDARARIVGGGPALECTLTDFSGSLLLLFLGRSRVDGMEPERRAIVEGTVGLRGGRRTILNPLLRVLS